MIHTRYREDFWDQFLLPKLNYNLTKKCHVCPKKIYYSAKPSTVYDFKLLKNVIEESQEYIKKKERNWLDFKKIAQDDLNLLEQKH